MYYLSILSIFYVSKIEDFWKLLKLVFKFPNRRLWNFYTSFSSFFKVQTVLNISAFYKAILLIYAVKFPMVFIYKFCKNFFNSTTRRASRTSSRWSLTKKVWSTQNFLKVNMTERIVILWRFFEKSSKKFNIESQDRKKT